MPATAVSASGGLHVRVFITGIRFFVQNLSPIPLRLRLPIRMISYGLEQGQLTSGECQFVNRSIRGVTRPDAKSQLRAIVRPSGPKDRIEIGHLRDFREVRVHDKEFPSASRSHAGKCDPL